MIITTGAGRLRGSKLLKYRFLFYYYLTKNLCSSFLTSLLLLGTIYDICVYRFFNR